MPDHSERKLATVLFADLVDSTAAAGEQDPERTPARLDRFYDAMSAEIEEAGGTGREVCRRRRDGCVRGAGGPRLEQAAEPGEILAGERTVSAVRRAFEFGEPKTVEAKGKAGGVACRPPRAIVRADDGLLTQADARFRALGLDWHADQTEALILLRNSAAAAPG